MTRSSTRIAVVATTGVWAIVLGYCGYLWAAGPFASNHYLEFQTTSDFLVSELGFVAAFVVPSGMVVPVCLERCRTTRLLAWLALPSFVFLMWSVAVFGD
jgi:hypothetical protein